MGQIRSVVEFHLVGSGLGSRAVDIFEELVDLCRWWWGQQAGCDRGPEAYRDGDEKLAEGGDYVQEFDQ